jgi:hypothetical protein
MANLYKYFQYIASYLGVVLLGGAIVHMPAAPFRYTILAIVGIVIFVFSSFFETRRKKAENPDFNSQYYIIISFFLSIGLGMLSGSIQHFMDTPMYSSVLLGLGFFISALAFYVRENPTLVFVNAVRYAGVVVAITALFGGGLYTVAHSIEPHSHTTHSHKH